MATLNEQPRVTPTEQVMTLKDWLITLFITAIPLVGLVMMFVWAFSSDTNLNKKNYAKATLILAAVLLVLYVVLIILMSILFASSSYYY